MEVNIYQTVLKDALGAFWEYNFPQDQLFISPETKALLGYSDELTDSRQLWQNMVLEEDYIKSNLLLQDHINSKGEIPYTVPVRFVHKNGTIIWMQSTGRVVEWADDGTPIHMVGCLIDITKHKQIEEQLKNAETFLSKTNEVARVGGWEINLKDKTVIWHKVTREIHEVPEDYVPYLQTAINFFKEGENRNKLTKALEDAMILGIPYELDLELVTAKGRTIWTRVIGLPELQDGKCVRLMGTIQDIDKQKRTQLELNYSEQLFRTAFTTSPIGMSIVSLDGKWIKVNEKLCEITGYSEEELLSMTFEDLTHPDDMSDDYELRTNAVKENLPNLQREKRYFHKSGRTIWVLIKVSLLKDADGIPLHFISQTEDITEQKTKEQQLLKVNQELSAIFNSNTQVAIIATDPKGVINHFSRGAEVMLGYTKEEMIGLQTPESFHLKSEVLERSQMLWELTGKRLHGFDLLLTLATHKQYADRQWTFVKKDGTLLPVQLGVAPIKDHHDQIAGYIGIATNISLQKEKEEELNRTLDIITEQNKRLQNFAYIVSHNLRSHVSNFSLLLDVIDVSETQAEQQEAVGHLHDIFNSLEETIRHLDEIIKIQTNISHEREPVNLYQYIEKTTDILHGEIQQKQATIINTVDPKLVVDYNPAYMESILLNLLTNAMKYRHPDRAPEIKLSHTLENGKISLQIEDNGIGLDLNKHGQKLFGMYKTFHGNSDAKGIGLFITKNQVDAMGGSIEVSSEVNQGTTFKIFF